MVSSDRPGTPGFSQSRLAHLRARFGERNRDDQLLQADQPQTLTFDPKHFVRASALGPWPGTHTVDSINRVRGELGAPHLPFLPELPHRGYAASQLARTVVALEGLTADGASFGWRLTEGNSREAQLAHTLFASDINALADVVGQETSPTGALKLQFTGPISLAAQLYLPNGERAQHDFGARRDLRDSFLAGVTSWIDLVKEAAPNHTITVQLDEPELTRALAGTIPTASGYRTLRSLPLTEVEESMARTVEALHRQVDSVALAGTDLPFSAPEQARAVLKPFDEVAFPVRDLADRDWEAIAEQIEADRAVWLGTVNPLQKSSVGQLAQHIWQRWRRVGLPAQRLNQVTVTEIGQLESLNPGEATAVLHDICEVARALAETASDD